MDNDDGNMFADAALSLFGARKMNETQDLLKAPSDATSFSKDAEMTVLKESAVVESAPHPSAGATCASVAQPVPVSSDIELSFGFADLESTFANLDESRPADSSSAQSRPSSDTNNAVDDQNTLVLPEVAPVDGRDEVDTTNQLSVRSTVQNLADTSLPLSDGEIVSSDGCDPTSSPASDVCTDDASVAGSTTVNVASSTGTSQFDSPWSSPIELPTSQSSYEAVIASRKKDAEKKEFNNPRLPMPNCKAIASKTRVKSKLPQHHDALCAPILHPNNGNTTPSYGPVIPPSGTRSAMTTTNASGHPQSAANGYPSSQLPPVDHSMPPYYNPYMPGYQPPSVPSIQPMPPHHHRNADHGQRLQVSDLHTQGTRPMEKTMTGQQNVGRQSNQPMPGAQPQPSHPLLPFMSTQYSYPPPMLPFPMLYPPYAQHGQPYHAQTMPSASCPSSFHRSIGNSYGTDGPVPLNQLPYSAQHIFAQSTPVPPGHVPQALPPFPYPSLNPAVPPPNRMNSPIQRVSPSTPKGNNQHVPNPPNLRPREEQSRRQEAPTTPGDRGPLDPIGSDFFLRFVAQQHSAMQKKHQSRYQPPLLPMPPQQVHAKSTPIAPRGPHPHIVQQQHRNVFPNSYPTPNRSTSLASSANLTPLNTVRPVTPFNGNDNLGRVLPSTLNRTLSSVGQNLPPKPGDKKRPYGPRLPPPPVRSSSASSSSIQFKPPSNRSTLSQAGPSAVLTGRTSKQIRPNSTFPKAAKSQSFMMPPDMPSTTVLDDDGSFPMANASRKSISPVPKKRQKPSKSGQNSMGDGGASIGRSDSDRKSLNAAPQVGDDVDLQVLVSSSTESMTLSQFTREDTDAESDKTGIEDDVICISDSDDDDDKTIVIDSDTEDSDFDIEDILETATPEVPFVYSDPKFDFINPLLNERCNGELDDVGWICDFLRDMKKDGQFEQHFCGKDIKDAESEIREYMNETRKLQRGKQTSNRLYDCILDEVDEPCLRDWKQHALSWFNSTSEDVDLGKVKKEEPPDEL